MNTNASFDFDGIYHVYNRTNNKEVLFKSDNNKRYFLRLLKTKLSNIANINAYALLDNHFHLLISIKSEEEIEMNLSKILLKYRSHTMNEFLNEEEKNAKIHKLVSISFSGLFNSYSQAINKAYNRKGNLFSRPFKRSQVFTQSKLEYLFAYMHKNSMKHGVVDSFLDERWSSYYDILDNNSEVVDPTLAFNLFDGKKGFIEFHEHYNQVYSFERGMYV